VVIASDSTAIFPGYTTKKIAVLSLAMTLLFYIFITY